jgi:hypothetical protein
MPPTTTNVLVVGAGPTGLLVVLRTALTGWCGAPSDRPRQSVQGPAGGGVPPSG